MNGQHDNLIVPVMLFMAWFSVFAFLLKHFG